jgi:hypothetical protein
VVLSSAMRLSRIGSSDRADVAQRAAERAQPAAGLVFELDEQF